jgi:hypothetical protein
LKTSGKIVAAVAAGLALCLALVAPSAAQEPYTGVISTTLTSPSMRACAGETNTARATGFLPGTEVTFTLVLPSGPVVLGDARASGSSKATADAAGVASVTFTLPADVALGTYDVVTTGINSAGAADEHVVRLTVVACPGDDGPTPTTGSGTSGDDLARTGSSLTGVTRIGVLVLAAGAVHLLVTRRRSSRTA